MCLPKSSHHKQYSFLPVSLGQSAHVQGFGLTATDETPADSEVNFQCPSYVLYGWASLQLSPASGDWITPGLHVFSAEAAAVMEQWQVIASTVLSRRGPSQAGVDARAALSHVTTLGLDRLGREREGRRGMSVEWVTHVCILFLLFANSVISGPLLIQGPGFGLCAVWVVMTLPPWGAVVNADANTCALLTCTADTDKPTPGGSGLLTHLYTASAWLVVSIP